MVFEQQLLGERLHADGGLLGALPLWAASEFGATHVIAIDVWKVGLARLQKVLPLRRKAPEGVEITVLTPSRPLGSVLDSLFWNRAQVEEWMELGAEDAHRLIVSGRLQQNISVGECFERQ
jgi:predicted acylesterase/phospholipase RssA